MMPYFALYFEKKLSNFGKVACYRIATFAPYEAQTRQKQHCGPGRFILVNLYARHIQEMN